jgi:hypothetical protein
MLSPPLRPDPHRHLVTVEALFEDHRERAHVSAPG